MTWDFLSLGSLEMGSSTIRPPAARRATLDDLMKVEGKAELIGGRIVEHMATGHLPNRVAGRIARSLDDDSEAAGARDRLYRQHGLFRPGVALGA